jgi:hypothetical protein
MFALILTLSMVVWAQGTSAPSAPNSTPVPEAKSCCHQMDQMKDGESCCHHAKAEAKEAMDCCGKDKCEMKDAKSCCKGKNMKACMKECKKDKNSCCDSANDKTAMNCCGKSCSRHQHEKSAS